MVIHVQGRVMRVFVWVEGSPLPFYRRNGDGQYFVAGVAGVPYTLQVENLVTHRKIEVLCSVDGRDTLKDAPADLQRSGGIVVSSNGRTTFKGWRLNNSQVGDFVFSDPQASVGQAAAGNTSNTGIIGFAAYLEEVSAPPPFTAYRSDREVLTKRSGGGFEESFGQLKGEPTLGTGIGEVRFDAVMPVRFQRASSAPDEVITIRYETEDWLRRNGIIISNEPQAFPGLPTGYERFLKKPY